MEAADQGVVDSIKQQLENPELKSDLTDETFQDAVKAAEESMSDYGEDEYGSY